MQEKVAQTKQAFTEGLQKVVTLQDLEQVRIKFLSRSGEIAVLFEGMKTVAASEKPALGKALNELRQECSIAIRCKKNIAGTIGKTERNSV